MKRSAPFFLKAVLFVALAAGRPALGQAADTVELATSRVYVFVGKAGLGHDHAVIGSLSAGRLHLGATQQAGELVIDIRSFRADTATARRVLGLEGETDPDTQRQVNENMLGPAVLDADRFPTAIFAVASVTPLTPGSNGKPRYELRGSFTLHGVSRPLTLRAEADTIGPVTRLWGNFTIRQTDYGMKPFAKLGGIIGVADELTIYGDIRLAAAPAAPLQGTAE